MKGCSFIVPSAVVALHPSWGWFSLVGLILLEGPDYTCGPTTIPPLFVSFVRGTGEERRLVPAGVDEILAIAKKVRSGPLQRCSDTNDPRGVLGIGGCL